MLLFKSIYWFGIVLLAGFLIWFNWKSSLDLVDDLEWAVVYIFGAFLLYYLILKLIQSFGRGASPELDLQLEETEDKLLGLLSEEGTASDKEGLIQLNLNSPKPDKKTD